MGGKKNEIHLRGRLKLKPPTLKPNSQFSKLN